MKRTAILNIVGLANRHLTEASLAPRLHAFAQSNTARAIDPIVPALTCSAQATYLTGLPPRDHGIVANGWYDRTLTEHQFWKQSNHLVSGEKLWETARRERPGFTCAKLFWWYNMYATADFTATPRPMYPASGKKVFDIYTEPAQDRFDVQAEKGKFPFPNFWGPMAGVKSSKWIADCAKWYEEKYAPDTSLVYLPHLDYDLQRLGAAGEASALPEIDTIFGDLLDYYTSKNVEVAVLSEYAITNVDRPVHLNRLFRKKGWLRIKDELGLEMADLGASKVFAIADHQVAHIYVQDESLLPQVRAVLESCDGVGEVLDEEGKKAAGLDHARSGEFIAVADARSWFTYYYWEDDAVAPDFARCIDIHRKIGYDPAELFFDPKLTAPKLRAAARLLQTKLGFRTLFDVVPLEGALVKGSHGRRPESEADWPVLIGQFPAGDAVFSTDVRDLLLGLLLKS